MFELIGAVFAFIGTVLLWGLGGFLVVMALGFFFDWWMTRRAVDAIDQNAKDMRDHYNDRGDGR